MKTERKRSTPAAGANLDRMVHAWMGRFTGGLSPASMLFAYLDWLVHLAFSPAKQAELGRRRSAR